MFCGLALENRRKTYKKNANKNGEESVHLLKCKKLPCQDDVIFKQLF